MTDARTLAVNCTAKLYTFRKTRDGVFAQFVIHPNEVPEKLQRDPIGTSYMMALVEVDDATGQPKGGGAAGTNKHAISETTPRPLEPGGGVKSYAQEAGRLCADKRFQQFFKTQAIKALGLTENDWDGAPSMATASFVRWFCDVDTRSDIIAGTFAASQFNKLVAEYKAEKVMA